MTKAVCIGFCGVVTVRRKWIEHKCCHCKGLLAKYHLQLQPSTHGPVKYEGGTEVLGYAT